MNIQPLFNIPSRLIDHEFTKFIEVNSSLLIGYHTQRPYGDPERDITKETYFEHVRAIETAYNKQHLQALHEYEQQLLTETPSIKKKTVLRLLLEKESDLVNDELSTRFSKLRYGFIPLKIDEDNFTKDRWIKALINHYSITDKPQKPTPLHKERILNCTDLDLFKSNVGINSEGANRSAFGVFSEQALVHLRTTCHSFLNEGGITTQSILSEQIDKLRQLPSHRRILLLSNSFVDTFSHMQHMQSGSLIQLQKITQPLRKWVKKTSGDVQIPTSLHYPFDTNKERFLAIINGEEVPRIRKKGSGIPKQLHERLLAPNQNPYMPPQFQKKAPDPTPPPVSSNKPTTPQKRKSLELTTSEKTDLINSLSYTFFIEAKCVLNSLSDFLTLLELRLEMDFTKEAHEYANRLQESSQMLDEESPIAAEAQDIIKIGSYIKIFKETKHLFKSLVEKTPPPPKED